MQVGSVHISAAVKSVFHSGATQAASASLALQVIPFHVSKTKMPWSPKAESGDEDEDEGMCSPRSGAEASTWNLSSTHSPPPPPPPPNSTPQYILSPSTIICATVLVKALTSDLLILRFNLTKVPKCQWLKWSKLVQSLPNSPERPEGYDLPLVAHESPHGIKRPKSPKWPPRMLQNCSKLPKCPRKAQNCSICPPWLNMPNVAKITQIGPNGQKWPWQTKIIVVGPICLKWPR